MAGRVIVGVDGSPASRKALRWAAEDAERRGAELQVVHVHEPKLVYNPYEVSYATTSNPRAVERLAAEERRWREHQRLTCPAGGGGAARRAARRAAPELRQGLIDRIVREGARPARLLLEAARAADLLVVGARGRGGFVGLLLGSVSQQVVQHATCPVVVVPPVSEVIDLGDLSFEDLERRPRS
jgi:nucleotide-binding universal stress UspA family protein